MKQTLIPDEAILSKIYHLRNRKVMLDRDLAILYGVETKALKQAVRRNLARFPEDFMFEMSREEFRNWRSQNVTSNLKEDKMGWRHAPFCFTEQGVTMISCILHSPKAIAVNIQIIRIFARMRETLLTQKDILLKLEQLEKQVSLHHTEIAQIFEVLKNLILNPEPPRKSIGFKVGDST